MARNTLSKILITAQSDFDKLKTLDTNKDNKLSVEELEVALKDDKNKNKKFIEGLIESLNKRGSSITFPEISLLHERIVKEINDFSKMDTNKDSKITRSEVIEQVKKNKDLNEEGVENMVDYYFSELDTNEDGVITYKEIYEVTNNESLSNLPSQ